MRGAAQIALAVGGVINRHKMAKHFNLDITDTSFNFTRKTAEIAAEAAIDGIYVVRTSLPVEPVTMRQPCAATNHSPWWSELSAVSKPSISRSGRSITGSQIVCARTCSCACWPITPNGTCARASRRCC